VSLIVDHGPRVAFLNAVDPTYATLPLSALGIPTEEILTYSCILDASFLSIPSHVGGYIPEHASALSADMGVDTQELASCLCQTSSCDFIPRTFATARHHSYPGV
jgi:hypothetical protein